ncbi:hypothetical protein M9Y10_039484 [Tritrichomonas musculus]|uniref:HNH nuclease domain-containing protein n=1 Tax=Tritrichomonas musculus TaxID=1915356 RepID=A0ABR2KBE4_9EUKA
MTQFVPLVNHEDYEILNEYPFTIRRRSTGYEVKEWINGEGYVITSMNGYDYRKHRLIALQFIPNPDNLPEVDHWNHNRADNHLENLHWVSSSNNQRNKSINKGVQYNFINKLPSDYIDVVSYETRAAVYEFNDKEYYYSPSTDLFYWFNGRQYKELHINHEHNGQLFVNMITKNSRKIKVFYTKFKIQYDLI